MKAKALKRYRKPGYPTRLEVLDDPDMLRRNVPMGWRAVPGMAGSIALFLAANSTVNAAEKKAAADGAAIVAPIFDHGEGRGATGCVVVAPPVFLSEEEAWQVIDEELAKRGVALPDSQVSLKGVKVPGRWENYSVKDGKGEVQVTDAGRPASLFSADRGDSKKHIGVEFVSYREYGKAGGAFSASTVQSYDFKRTAASLAKDVREQAQDKVYFGVLYDPLVNIRLEKLQEQWKKKEKTSRNNDVTQWREDQAQSVSESKRLLRLQVQDFLKWLEGQGVI